MSVRLGGGAHVSDAKAAFSTCPVKVLKLKSELPLSGGGSGVGPVSFYDPKFYSQVKFNGVSYQAQRLLGGGSGAGVYKCWCQKTNTVFVLKKGEGKQSLEPESQRMKELYEQHRSLGTPECIGYDSEEDAYCMEYIEGSLLRDWICTCSSDELELVANQVVTLVEAFQSSSIGTQQPDTVTVVSKVHYAIRKLDEAMKRDNDLKNDKLLSYLFDIVKKMFSGQKEIQFEVEKWRLSDVARVVLGQAPKLLGCSSIAEERFLPAIVNGHGDLTPANIIVDGYKQLRPIDPRSDPGNSPDSEKIVWPGGFVVDGSVYIDQLGQLHNTDKLEKSIEFSKLLKKKLNSNTYNASQFIRDMRVALERIEMLKAGESEKTLLINRIRTDLVLFILFYYSEVSSPTSYTMH